MICSRMNGMGFWAFDGGDDFGFNSFNWGELPALEYEYSPDAYFTDSPMVLTAGEPTVMEFPPPTQVDLISQGYDPLQTDSGQSTFLPPGQEGEPSYYDTELTGGNSTFVTGAADGGGVFESIAKALPALIKTLTEYDLKRLQLELDRARLDRNYPLPSLGGKRVASMRVDPNNPATVSYTHLTLPTKRIV